MFKYYNAHPRKLSVGDCVKRSITLTTGIPYVKVERGLNEHKKIIGVKQFNHYPNPDSYMENILGFPKITVSQKANGSHQTVGDFAKSHPQGRYVISVSGHWTACINGMIYDTWDCSSRVVLSYFEVTRFTRMMIERKYCYTVRCEQDRQLCVTVYDGNGISCAKTLAAVDACVYMQYLQDRGFFDLEEMGEYI